MIRFSNGTKTTSPQNSIAQIGIILFISSVEDGILSLGLNLKVSGGAGGYCPHRFSHSIKTLVLLLLLLLLLHTTPMYIYPPPPQNCEPRILDVQTAADV